MDKIRTDKLRFIDDKGRERIFNGVNLVYKGRQSETNPFRKNYTPTDWDESMFSYLKSKGINLVRLGLQWDAVEPECGIYDKDYLNLFSGYIDLCAKYGIYVFLDMHQDLYSAQYSDGAPRWATVSDGKKYHKSKIIWAMGYFIDPAVHKASDNFWNNREVYGKGLQDHFADMWKYVVNYYKDKKNIIGYDIYNEPCPGTDSFKIFASVAAKAVGLVVSPKIPKIKTIRKMAETSVVEGALGAVTGDIFVSATSAGSRLNSKFTMDYYYPFLKKISSAIRQIDKENLIVIENSYWSNVAMPCLCPKIVYDDGKTDENIVFAPHGYDITVDSENTNLQSPDRVDRIFEEHKKTQDRLSCPVIVGEYGGVVPGIPDYPGLKYQINLFDKNKWSHTFWAFGMDFKDTPIMDILSRPYPVFVDGRIISYGVDFNSKKFKLVYDSANENAEAEVYCPTKPKNINSSSKTEAEYFDGYTILHIASAAGKNELTFNY